uniref:MICOS complex subunit MIC60 n=1 Tax=Ditylenchus dipsaci TaxID=166011 RepID=A0A915DMX5_9BILA
MKKKLLTAISLTTAIGAGAGYAYLNPEQMPPEVREWVKKVEDSINQQKQKPVIFKVGEVINKSIVDVSHPIEYVKSKINPSINSGQQQQQITPVVDSNIKAVDVRKPLDDLSNVKPKTAEEESKLLKEVDARLLNALEQAEKKVKAATEAKYNTITAIRTHADTLKKAVDDGQNGDWEAVNEALRKAENLAKVDIGQEATGRNAIDALRKTIADAKSLSQKVAGKSSMVLLASETANKFAHQLDELNHMAEKARNERRIFNQYKDLIDKSRQHFAQELNSIVPGVDVHAKEDKLTQDELNALIAHAYLRVDQFRRQLAEQQVREEQNIAKAIEDQRKADAEVADAQLDLEVRRVKENVNIDVDKKVLEERKAWEAELEARLQRASLAHAEHLESVIRTQKQLHDIENAKLVEEAVTQERNLHLKQVQQSVAKLQGIENALQSRVGWDAENRRSKQYWLACQNLVESVPLAEELEVIKQACEQDNFVQSLINCFPKSAVEQGVYTEQDLKNRFGRIYKLGKQTAKIDENGGTLLKYLSSYLQSWFMIELPTKAKYFVEHDDLDTAVRLVNMLDGQPGRLAKDWVTDALSYLETRYLAQLLVDHATVTSIRSIY